MSRVLGAVMVLFLLVMSVPAGASIVGTAIYDISVTPDGDWVSHRQWYYGGNDRWTDVGANPNQVSHSYSPGWGDSAETGLSFDLGSIKGKVADIVSATFNFNITSIWTDGRNDVANLNGVGTVYYDGGIGWKSFDITDSFRTLLAGDSKTADYHFSYTGYSGFQFSSAEGGQPAFLRITTDAPGAASPVPVPPAVWLLGTGMIGLFGVKRRLTK